MQVKLSTKTTVKQTAIIGALIATMTLSLFADTKGEAVAQRFFDLKSANDTKGTATMVVISKKGSKRVRKLNMTTKDSEFGTDSYIEFLEPADVKGTKFLTVATVEGEEQRLWLPALKKVRRISSSGKKGKFVGSDFTYYDMEDRNFDEANYTFIETKTIDGEPFDVIEIVSKDATTPYLKSIAYAKQSDGFIYKSEFFDRKSKKLIKTLVVVETKVQEGIIIPVKVVMDNHKGGTKTVLITSNIMLNSGVTTATFSVKNLEK